MKVSYHVSNWIVYCYAPTWKCCHLPWDIAFLSNCKLFFHHLHKSFHPFSTIIHSDRRKRASPLVQTRHAGELPVQSDCGFGGLSSRRLRLPRWSTSWPPITGQTLPQAVWMLWMCVRVSVSLSFLLRMFCEITAMHKFDFSRAQTLKSEPDFTVVSSSIN